MVQIFETSDPRSKIGEMLGMGLGQGLSSGINSYFANKAIDDVVNDESLNGKPLSTKMGKLLSAVAPYGELGRQLFQDRFQIEQQAYNENQAKEKQKEALGKEQRLFAQQKELQGLKNAGKAEKATNPLDQAIPQDQIEKIENVLAANPDASQEQLGLALGKAGVNPRYHAPYVNARKPKAPVGGVTNQPIPQEQIEAIEDVIKNNPNATADELAIALAKKKVNPLYSKDYVESRRRTDETKSKNDVEENKIARKEDILFHNESAKYAEEVSKNARVAKKQLDTIGDVETSLASNNIRPLAISNIFKGFGEIGDKISKAFLNKDQATLQSAIPEFLEGRKELFGVRLSDADLRLLQDKLPDIGNSKAANDAILKIMKKYANHSILKETAAENVLESKGLKTRGGKLRPLNYVNEVEKEYDKLIKEYDESKKPKTSFETMPPAMEYNGRRLKNKETGQILESNGTNWRPV